MINSQVMLSSPHFCHDVLSVRHVNEKKDTSAVYFTSLFFLYFHNVLVLKVEHQTKRFVYLAFDGSDLHDLFMNLYDCLFFIWCRTDTPLFFPFVKKPSIFSLIMLLFLTWQIAGAQRCSRCPFFWLKTESSIIWKGFLFVF